MGVWPMRDMGCRHLAGRTLRCIIEFELVKKTTVAQPGNGDLVLVNNERECSQVTLTSCDASEDQRRCNRKGLFATFAYAPEVDVAIFWRGCCAKRRIAKALFFGNSLISRLTSSLSPWHQFRSDLVRTASSCLSRPSINSSKGTPVHAGYLSFLVLFCLVGSSI